MSKPQSKQGKRAHNKKHGSSDHHEISLHTQLLNTLPFNSFIVAQDLIEVLMESFEMRLIKKEIKKKCKPYAVNSMTSQMRSIAALSQLSHDRKFDDIYVNAEVDTIEPGNLGSDPMCPSKVTLDKRNITVINDGESIEQSMIEGSIAGGAGGPNDRISDKKSIKSIRVVARSRKVSPKERKTPKPISLDEAYATKDENVVTGDDLGLQRTDTITELIETQRKRIIKMELEEKKKQKLSKKRPKINTDSIIADIDITKLKPNQSYHVEDNGQIILVKKPAPDRFPKQFTTPLQANLEVPTELVVESEFNKQFKQKKAQGLIKEISMNEIEEEHKREIQQSFRQGGTKAIDSQFTNIYRNFKPKKGVNYISNNPDEQINPPADQSQKQSAVSVTQQKQPPSTNKESSKSVATTPIKSPSKKNAQQQKLQMSISEYREKFDLQNIAMSKFEEIKKVRLLSSAGEGSFYSVNMSQNFTQGQGYANANNTFLADSMYESKIISKEETLGDDIVNTERKNNIFQNNHQRNKSLNVQFLDTSYSQFQESKISTSKHGSIAIKYNPTILVDEPKNAYIQSMLPKIVAQTPQTVYSQYVSRKNSMKRIEDMNNSLLNSSRIIDYTAEQKETESHHGKKGFGGVESQLPSINRLNTLNSTMIIPKSLQSRTDRKVFVKTAQNSPDPIQKEDLSKLIQLKAQPRKMLEKLKIKMKQEDEKLTLGREGAFGEITTVHVKPLKNQHFKSTARNMLSLKQYKLEQMESEKKLPPPQLGRTMGHGILNQTLDSISSHRL